MSSPGPASPSNPDRPAKDRYEALAAEFLRALRGKRSHAAFSRRIGARSNVSYTWETGRRWPTASKAFWVAQRVGCSVDDAISSFYRRRPDWLEKVEATSAAGVVALMSDLRGKTPLTDVAERCGRTRFAVSRWLSGKTEPRLPDFFRYLEGVSHRLLDFIAAFVDPLALPSAAPGWSQLQQARRAAYEHPWSHAVLRLLETRRYQALQRHYPGWIAARLNIPHDEEQVCLKTLEAGGQIAFREQKWRVQEVRTVDTHQDREAGQRLKCWWARVGLERLEAEAPGQFSYNLCTVSEADYRRLRELHLAYFRQLRSIVAESEPCERVVLVNMQMMPLDTA